MTQLFDSDTRHLIPDAERARSQRAVVNSSTQVAPNPKQMLNKSVYPKKPLRVRGGFEPAHLALSLPRRLGGDLSSIVGVLVGNVDHGRHDDPVGR